MNLVLHLNLKMLGIIILLIEFKNQIIQYHQIFINLLMYYLIKFYNLDPFIQLFLKKYFMGKFQNKKFQESQVTGEK